MKKKVIASALFLCLTSSPVQSDSSVNVPLEHWSYGFIDRLEAKGLLRMIKNGTRPFSRMEMAEAIGEIIKKASELTEVERGEMEELKAEFAEELSALGIDPGYSRRKGSFLRRLAGGDHLIVWEEGESNFRIDLLFGERAIFNTGDSNPSAERISQTTLGGVIRGSFKGSVGFRIGFRNTREQGTRVYRSRDDVFEKRLEYVAIYDGNYAYFREATAYLVFSLPWFQVEVGKDFILWGSGFFGNLALSDSAPSYDMIKLKAEYGRFKLTSVTGFLRSDSPDSARSYIVNGHVRDINRRKYLAAHRLEVTVYPGLDLGFYEVVIYGDRGLELTYLNPVMFYWPAQSYLGDKDNLMIGMDFDANLIKNLKLYGEILIDDLWMAKLGEGVFSNKFAFQGGALWADPLHLPDTDLRVEYVRIEPWVYTHKFPINSYRHSDSILGHPLGPNADKLSVQVDHRFSNDLSLALLFERERQGQNEVNSDGTIRNVGGDASLGYRRGDETRKKFLDGILEKRTSLGFRLSYELIRDLYLLSSYRRTHSDNIVFKDGERGSPTDNEVILSISYNYF